MLKVIVLTCFVLVTTLATLNAWVRLSGEEQLLAAAKSWKKQEDQRGDIVKSARNEAIGQTLGFVLEALWVVFCSGALLFILAVRAMNGDAIAPYAGGGWLVLMNCINLFVAKRGSGTGTLTMPSVHLVEWGTRIFRPQQDVESQVLLTDMTEAD